MKRFLIVDDDELSRIILADFLSEFAVCDTAASGSDGLELFKKALIESRPYDLVCSDVFMPEMDGHEMVEKIRSYEDSQPIIGYSRAKIFMISASGSPKDMTHAILDNSCDDYILKPFHRDSLRALLNIYELIEHDNQP